MAGPYELFKTDDNLETKGVVLNYGDFKITVARAGGSNKKYARIFEAKLRPYRRAMETNTLDEKIDRRIMAEVFAESVVVGWEGVKDEDGEAMAFTKENVVKLLTELPDLFSDIMVQAKSVSTFRADDEADAKN